MRNPFQVTRVSNVWDNAIADLPELNEAPFKDIRALVESVESNSQSAARVIFGSAGSGKTHLLSRLRRHYASREEAIFCYCRLDSSASMFWRHLRRQVFESILKGDPSPLDRLLTRSAHRFDSISSRNLRNALANLAVGRHRYDTLAWLRGENLSEAALSAIGLDLGNEVDEDMESEAKELLLALVAWVAPTRILLCLDQVEAIQDHPGDFKSLFTLGKHCASLVDSTTNLCLVLCMQTAFVDLLEQHVRGADQDRFLRSRSGLEPMDSNQAIALVNIRQSGIPNASPTWPVDQRKLLASMKDGREVVRKVLFKAAELFDEGSGQPPPPRLTREQFLAEAFEEELANSHATVSPATANPIHADGLPLLLYQLGWIKQDSPAGLPAPCITIKKGNSQKHLVLLNESHGGTLAAKLKKVLNASVDPNQVRIVRDANLGIRDTAKGAKACLDQLRAQGAQLIHVSTAQLAALDAMRKILSKCESGDLAFEGDSLAEDFVAHWLGSHRPEALDQLHNEIVGDEPALPDHLEAIAAYLADTKVAAIESISAATGLSRHQVEQCAHLHPQQLVLLAGETPVLCQGSGA